MMVKRSFMTVALTKTLYYSGTKRFPPSADLIANGTGTKFWAASHFSRARRVRQILFIGRAGSTNPAGIPASPSRFFMGLGEDTTPGPCGSRPDVNAVGRMNVRRSMAAAAKCLEGENNSLWYAPRGVDVPAPEGSGCRWSVPAGCWICRMEVLLT